MDLIKLIIVSLAVASISWTITKSLIFLFLRSFFCKRSKFLGNLFSCPYCLSHWVSFIFMFYLYKFSFNFILMSFAAVTLSTIWTGMINRALDFIILDD